MPDLPLEILKASNWIESPILVRLVGRVARHHDVPINDLPDLVQETRIALWEMGLDVPVSPALVLRIASNKAIDVIRGRVRRHARDTAAALVAFPREHNEELDHLLNARIAELPPRLHEFYELHYQQGLSEREIARTWGLC